MNWYKTGKLDDKALERLWNTERMNKPWRDSYREIQGLRAHLDLLFVDSTRGYTMQVTGNTLEQKIRALMLKTQVLQELIKGRVKSAEQLNHLEALLETDTFQEVT